MDIKRYEAKDAWSTNGYYYPVFSECEDGEWVQYLEAKGIIEESFQLGQDSIDIEHMEEIKILRKALDYPADIPLMIQRAIKAEREVCALICDDHYNAWECAEAIRGRNE